MKTQSPTDESKATRALHAHASICVLAGLLVVLGVATELAGQQILANWPGMSAPTGSVPPDPSGAAGPNGILQTVNTSVQYWNKAGGTNWGPVTFTAFWAGAGNSGNGNADAKVLFDPVSARFYVVIQENNRTTRRSFMILAVSRTAHPTTSTTADWFFYRMEMTSTRGSVNYGGDYPGFAVDGQAIYVTFNMFELTATGFTGVALNTQIIAINKTDANSGTLTANRIFSPDIVTGLLGSLVPVNVTGSGGPGNQVYLVQVTLPVAIALWVLKDPLGTPVLLPPAIMPVPPNGGLPGVPGKDAPQSGTSVLLDTIGEELKAQGNAVWVDGTVWFCYTGGDPFSNRSRVYYYQILPSNWPDSGLLPGWGVPNLSDPGFIDGGNGVWTFQPALGANSCGDLCLVYSQSSATTFPSIRSAIRLRGATTFGTPFVVRTSPTFYNGTQAPNRPPNVTRWGDYANVCQDPVDGAFWVTHEWARSSTADDWGTWWARIAVTRPPAQDIYVNNTLTCFFQTGQRDCAPQILAGPYKRVLDGVNAADCGDTVNIRAGVYNESLTINRAVRLQSYDGAAHIGR